MRLSVFLMIMTFDESDWCTWCCVSFSNSCWVGIRACVLKTAFEYIWSRIKTCETRKMIDFRWRHVHMATCIVANHEAATTPMRVDVPQPILAAGCCFTTPGMRYRTRSLCNLVWNDPFLRKYLTFVFQLKVPENNSNPSYNNPTRDRLRKKLEERKKKK